MTCFVERVHGLLHDVDAVFADVDPARFSSIKAATAYFRALPDRVTVAELNRTDDAGGGDDDDGECDATQCRLERVLASGRLLVADSPSTACRSPDNLAEIMEDVVVLAERGECTFYQKTQTLSASQSVKGAVIGNTKGSIFTMGTDGTEQPLDLPSFMVDKLSFDALSLCAATLDAADLRVEMVEIMTRCEEEELSQINVHGDHTHFTVSSLSNTQFVVKQHGGTFKISLPADSEVEND